MGSLSDHFHFEMSFFPSFHRRSRLVVRKNGPNELEFSVEPQEEGLFLRRSLPIGVLDELQETCLKSLRSYNHDTWNSFGLDGITVSGRFAAADFVIGNFGMWSPRPGSPAHMLVAAALECLPFNSVSGKMETYLEQLRSYFFEGGFVRLVPGAPPRLRMSCYVKNNKEHEDILTSLPPAGDLIVDMSNLSGMDEETVAMLLPLVRRGSSVRWLVSLHSLPRVEALAVLPSQIVDYADLKRQQAEKSLLEQQERALLLKEKRRREEELSNRLDQARHKAINMGIARMEDVDRVIYNMPVEEFRRHFAEFHVSRAFFKRR